MSAAYGDWSPYERSHDRIGLIDCIDNKSLLKPLMSSAYMQKIRPFEIADTVNVSFRAATGNKAINPQSRPG